MLVLFIVNKNGERENIKHFPFHRLQSILFENNSDAETDIIINASVGINRIIVNLNGAEINFVVDFNIQSASERAAETRVGKSEIRGI